jgi:hypothetical protein
MTYFRLLLRLGCVGAVVAMSQRVRARGPLDVDATAYGGAESAGYGSCTGRAGIGANYGGLGVQVRAHPQAAAGEREGLTVTAAAAMELERFRLIECSGDCVGFDPNLFPVQRFLGGGYLRLGNDWRDFGLHAGALVLPQFIAAPGAFSWSAPIPDLYLRLGRLESFYVDLGHHSPLTVFHPGLHLGLNYVPEPGWLISLHGGIGLRFGPDAWGSRAEFDLRTPVSDSVQVGLGGAVSNGLHHAEYEVRSTVGLRL